MRKQGERIGNFTSVTTPLVVGSVAMIAMLGAVLWCWSRSLADPNSVPWLLTLVVTAAAIPSVLGCAIWAASGYVRWIAVGEELTFATLFGCQTVSWDDVRGIGFGTADKAIPLVVLPLKIVVWQNIYATITLNSGRVLEGSLNHHDVLILHELLNRHPRLDAHLTRALASPRAAMTTFVDAVMEEQLAYASKFLDFSHFDEQTAHQLAEPCAQKLKEVIDSVWFIDYEEIPDEADSPSPYVLASGSDQDIDEDLLPLVRAIKISRCESSGHWRFDCETVEMIVKEFLMAADE